MSCDHKDCRCEETYVEAAGKEIPLIPTLSRGKRGPLRRRTARESRDLDGGSGRAQTARRP